MGHYKELLGTVGMRWLKWIMVVATSTYIIDTPWKLTVKGLMGRMLTYRGHSYRDLEYISPQWLCLLLEGCVLIWTWSRIHRHLAVGEAAHSCCVSEQFLDFLPWLCPPLLEQPGLGCCVSICWDAVWTKAGSLPEELRSTRRRAKLFQFPTYMIQFAYS